MKIEEEIFHKSLGINKGQSFSNLHVAVNPNKWNEYVKG